MLPNQSCTAFPRKKPKKAQVLNPASGWVSKTPSLCSTHAGEACAWTRFLCENTSVLMSAWWEGIQVLCDWQAGKNHKWNKCICMSPTRCVHFTSLNSTGKLWKRVFSKVINEVTGSGALSDLRGSGYKLVHWVADLHSGHTLSYGFPRGPWCTFCQGHVSFLLVMFFTLMIDSV